MQRGLPRVAFLDLHLGVSGVDESTPLAWRKAVGRQTRIGAICASDAAAEDLRSRLEDAGHFDAIDPELLVVESRMGPGVEFPDPRAFAVLAALASASPDECVFVSSEPDMLVGAAIAGMRTVAVDSEWTGAAGASVIGRASPVRSSLAPSLVAAEMPAAAAAEPVEEQATFALRGRVVTMNSRSTVYDDGIVVISEGTIAHVAPAERELPSRFALTPVITTAGTIYPGLIDLHNHFVYNVLPLWPIEEPFTNRTQWPRRRKYTAEVSLPVRLLASFSSTSRAIVRFIETRAILGGTTTGQGVLTRIKGSRSLFKGAMRNVELPRDPRLAAGGTRVPDLGGRPQDIASFRRNLERRDAYFYHLAEGVDDNARDKFFDLEDNDLIQSSLVGIHSLGLHRADLDVMAERGAKIVWSPFSNLLLYGRTVDIPDLLGSGVTFSLGCDWGPTGSVNLLQELKVARFESDRQGVSLSDETLVRLVTTNAAKVVTWDHAVGTIRRTAVADLIVVSGTSGDPYAHLIAATEDNVDLVMVDGKARSGSPELMRALHPGRQSEVESLLVRGREKLLHLRAPESGLDDVTFAAATNTLAEAMGDLPQFKADMEEMSGQLLAMGQDSVEEFQLELDNEFDEVAGAVVTDSELLANWDLLTEEVDLLPPVAEGANYLARIEAQKNLSDELKAHLKQIHG